MSATATPTAPAPAKSPIKSPLLDATDSLVAWVQLHGTGKRGHGQLNADEWKELTALDDAFGEAIALGCPGRSMPPAPPTEYIGGEERPLSAALPNCNLGYRHIAGTPPARGRYPVKSIDPENQGAFIIDTVEATIEGSEDPPRWWLLKVDSWLAQMRRFRGEAASMK